LLRPLVDDLAELHQKEDELSTHALAQSSDTYGYAHSRNLLVYVIARNEAIFFFAMRLPRFARNDVPALCWLLWCFQPSSC